jgi:hypothetical protein
MAPADAVGLSTGTPIYIIPDAIVALDALQGNAGAGATQTDSSLQNTRALLQQQQDYIVEQFQRRGLLVKSAITNTANGCGQADGKVKISDETAIALHWRPLNGGASGSTTNPVTGTTTSSTGIYWIAQDCSGTPAIIWNHTAQFSEGTNYRVRFPLDFIASMLGVLALIHPGGTALVTASTGGTVSAFGGAVNTALSVADKPLDPVRAAQERAAFALADRYCNANHAIDCLKVKKP